MKKALLITALAIAAGATAIGCGDDDNQGDAALSKSEFLARGNRICKKGNEEIESAFSRFKRPPTTGPRRTQPRFRPSSSATASPASATRVSTSSPSASRPPATRRSPSTTGTSATAAASRAS